MEEKINAIELIKEVIRLEDKIRKYIKRMVEEKADYGETLTFIVPTASFIHGAPQQINGVIRTKDGRIKIVVDEWKEEEYPTYYTLSADTLAKIASKLEMGTATKQINEKQNG